MAGVPTLLPMMSMISTSTFSGDRRCSSGGPLRDRRIRIYSPPLPAVAEDGVAWCGSDRPTVLFDTSSKATPPRPGPASLLSSSLRPQPGHRMTRGGRVGVRLRAAGTAGAGAKCSNVCAVCRIRGAQHPVTFVIQERANVVSRSRLRSMYRAPRPMLSTPRVGNKATIDGAASDHEQA